MPFITATEAHGVAERHIPAIAEVCAKRNCFVFIRPSEQATVRLIKAGFATKSMDIHEKSSDWGLHSGLVPQDPAFSKKLTGDPKADIHPHAHGVAESIPLKFTREQFEGLSGQRHFEHTVEVLAPSGCPGGWVPGHRHFHADSKRPELCLLLGADLSVSWKMRNGDGGQVPLLVMAYSGVPVTGDYDLWMVTPSFRWIRGSEEILTNPDEHGRSASLKFTQELNDAFNEACKPQYPNGKNVFNHGAEAQNISFTQEMESKPLVVCCPGPHEPFVIHALNEHEKLTQIFHDLLRHGYVVMRNPKWKHGFTLGAEDLAFAPEVWMYFEPGLKKAIDFARGEVRALAEGAATVIQQAWRRKKNGGGSGRKRLSDFGGDTDAYRKYLLEQARLTPLVGKFRARAAKLAEFRKVADIPPDQGRDLILPKEVFPPGWRLSIPQDLEAREISEKQEQGFKRTRYELDGDRGGRHIVPVDESSSAEPDDTGYYQAMYGHDWAKMKVLADLRKRALLGDPEAKRRLQALRLSRLK